MWVCDSSEQYRNNNYNNNNDDNNIAQKSSKMKQKTWKLKKLGLEVAISSNNNTCSNNNYNTFLTRPLQVSLFGADVSRIFGPS